MIILKNELSFKYKKDALAYVKAYIDKSDYFVLKSLEAVLNRHDPYEKKKSCNIFHDGRGFNRNDYPKAKYYLAKSKATLSFKDMRYLRWLMKRYANQILDEIIL